MKKLILAVTLIAATLPLTFGTAVAEKQGPTSDLLLGGLTIPIDINTHGVNVVIGDIYAAPTNLNSCKGCNPQYYTAPTFDHSAVTFGHVVSLTYVKNGVTITPDDIDVGVDPIEMAQEENRHNTETEDEADIDPLPNGLSISSMAFGAQYAPEISKTFEIDTVDASFWHPNKARNLLETQLN